MIKLFHNNIASSKLPNSVEQINIEDLSIVKFHLKELLSENEGEEYVKVCIFDKFIDNETTFVEYFIKYLNLDIFKIHIIDPKKNYIIPEAMELNLHFNINEKKIMDKVKKFHENNENNAKMHVIDEFKFASITNIDDQ
ncbi:hypothetical protein PBI_SCTP2_97 [Salicola phage SCTP-2]|nr:hypothetical protein PBI_SCTP2_97 [Salicola phage SCTP-2]